MIRTVDSWRVRVDLARARYELAKSAALAAARQCNDLPTTDGNLAFRKALATERQTLNEYTEMLLAYSKLVLSGEDTDLSERPPSGQR